MTLLILLSHLSIALGIATGSAVSNVSYHERQYLYAGGHYVNDSTGSHTLRGQMYVEHLTPLHPGNSTAGPLVFIHGQGQTGTNWLNKPDGGSGWTSYFLARGYELYIVDQPFRGRSPWFPRNTSDTLSYFSTTRIEQRFTAPKLYELWPQAKSHTQWLGNGTKGDHIFDTYYRSTVPYPYGDDAVYQQRAVQIAFEDLLDTIGKPVTLIAHSQGGIMPWLIADARPSLVNTIVAMEPSGPPFMDQVFTQEAARPYGLTDAPLTYEPAISEDDDPESQFVVETTNSTDPAVSNCTLQVEADGHVPKKLANLQDIPVAVLTSETSFHAVYDWCTVEFLKQAGVNAEHIKLSDLGIHGNGHLFFMEANSNSIAGVVQDWIENASRRK